VTKIYLGSNLNFLASKKRKLSEISSSESEEEIDKIPKSSHEPSTSYNPSIENENPSTSKKPTNEDCIENDIGK